MRKFCWVYMDIATGDLWLCKRPHRRAWHAEWEFIREPDDCEVLGFWEMVERFIYIGRF